MVWNFQFVCMFILFLLLPHIACRGEWKAPNCLCLNCIALRTLWAHYVCFYCYIVGSPVTT